MSDLDRAASAIEEFLEALGIPSKSDPELHGTGQRVAEAFASELLAGYAHEPSEILQQATTSDAKGWVVVQGIPCSIVCPHHLLPATGWVHVGYLPSSKVVGLGAMSRLVRCLGQRLVLQEDFCQNVASALVKELGALSAGCIADLKPSCLTARGPRDVGARVLTQAFAGAAAHDAEVRREFSSLLSER